MRLAGVSLPCLVKHRIEGPKDWQARRELKETSFVPVESLHAHTDDSLSQHSWQRCQRIEIIIQNDEASLSR